MLGRRLDALLAAVGFTALAHPAATQETAVAEVAAGPRREGDELVRVRLRAERLVWGTSLLAWLDRPFVTETPEALRARVRALAWRLAASAGGG